MVDQVGSFTTLLSSVYRVPTRVRVKSFSGDAGVCVFDCMDPLVVNKTYTASFGEEHTSLYLFWDRLGAFGFWQRGHFYYTDKLAHSSRGVFRMWEPEAVLLDA